MLQQQPTNFAKTYVDATEHKKAYR